MITATRDPITLPRVRDGLTIQPISPTEYVVKRADSREYFSIGPQEACLLELLDGQNSVEDIQATFEFHFQSSLSEEDLRDFISAVEPMGLFRPTTKASSESSRTKSSQSSVGGDDPGESESGDRFRKA